MKSRARPSIPHYSTLIAVTISVIIVLSPIVGVVEITAATGGGNTATGFTQLDVTTGKSSNDRPITLAWTLNLEASTEKLVIEFEEADNSTVAAPGNPKTIVDPSNSDGYTINFRVNEKNTIRQVRVTQIHSDGTVYECAGVYDENGMNIGDFDCGEVESPDPLALSTSPGNASFREGAGAVLVDDSLTINGSSFDSFTNATVSIDEGFDAGADTLDFDESVIPYDDDGSGDPIITGDYNELTGVLSFEGTAGIGVYQDLLRTTTYNNSRTPPTTADRNLTFTLTAADQSATEIYYNPATEHYYEYVTNPGVDWSFAKTDSEARSYAGMTGYLATVTSEAENDFLVDRFGEGGWLGASDAASEGEWRWITGPEGDESGGDGRHFYTQTAAHVAYTDPYPAPPAGVPGGGSTESGAYANWHPRHEPDNKFPFFGGEDYVYLCAGAGRCSEGMWQDAKASSPNFQADGYYVEYGAPDASPDSRYSNITTTRVVTVTTATSDDTPPTADAGPDQIVDPGDTVTLSASNSSDDQGILRYEWDLTANGRTDLTGETNTTSFDPPSNYTVTLTVTDAGGNTDTDTLTIEVTDTNLPTVVISAPDRAERGESLSFTGTNSTDDIAIAGFEWDFGDGSENASGVSPVHGYDAPGTYTVTLTVTDLAGNANTTTHDITIDPSPRPLISNVSATNLDGADLTVSIDTDQVLDTIEIGVYDTDLLSPRADDSAARQYTIVLNGTRDDFGTPTFENGNYTYTNTTAVSPGNYTIRIETAANDITGDSGTGQEVTITSLNVGPAGMAGGGTLENPYVITNATQLQAMNQSLTAHYILGNDIKAIETASWNGGAGFTPVGDCPDSHSSTWDDCSGGTPFTGSLDGQSYAITNLSIDRPSGTGVGLFGLADNASFRNIRLVDVNVTGEENVGGLVGHMQGSSESYPYGEVENVSVSGDVTWSGTGSGNAGGKFGGLVGLASNAKLVNQNVFRGNVTGKFNVGGLVGRMAYDTTIGTSYAQGTVTSTAAVDSECTTGNEQCEAGGLAGNSGNPSSITNAYAAVEVTAPTAGAIIGMDNGADTLTNVYWDTTIGAANASSGSIDDGGSSEYMGLTTSQMQGDTATGHMNFDWNDTWQTVPGHYPVFQWEANAMNHVTITGTVTNALDGASLVGATVNSTIDTATTDGSGSYTLNVSAFGDAVTATATVDEGFTITTDAIVSNPNDVTTLDLALGPTYDGSGTQANPYQVDTLEDLQQIRYDLSAEYVLTGDIDVSATDGWFSGGGFKPLGNGGNQFTGAFDGAGNTVTGLTIDRDGSNHVGLFGYLQSSATVENVSLHDVDITGYGSVGGIVGVNQGTIRNVSTTGDVHAADWRAGGVVGRNRDYGFVTRSFSSARISSPSQPGGLVGRNHGTVTDSYATGDVIGGVTVGGLIGRDSGATTASFSTGAVSGSRNVGGLEGSYDGAAVSSSFWDVNQSTQQSSSAGTGLATDQMTSVAAETNMSGFDFSSTWISTDSYPVLAWQVTGLQLGLDSSSINQTNSTNATVTLTLHDGSTVTTTDPASYATNNLSVATTTGGGRINGAGVGTATITATHMGYSDTASLTVTEGDVTAPGISNLSISNPTGQTIEVTLESNETLSTIGVSITNATARNLARGDFTVTSTGSGYRYTATINDSTDGTYEATLTAAADAARNDGASGEQAIVTVDTTAPVLTNVSASNPNGDLIAITLDASERLTDLTINITGAENATLRLANATETHTGGRIYSYNATYGSGTDGTYTATITGATDAAGNDGGANQSASTTVNTEPVVGAAAASSYYIDVGTSVTLRAGESTVHSGSTPTYEWDVDGDGTTDTTGKTTNHAFGTPGTHDVTLTVTVGGENDTDTITITVVDTTSPSVDLGADRTIAEGDTESFDVSGSISDDVGITAIEWDFDGDGSTDATGASTSHTFGDSGTHTVTVTVRDAAGNTESVSIRVHVEGPEAVIDTTRLDSGDTAIGSTSTEGITISNIGTTPLNVTGTTISGPDQSAFAVTGTTPPFTVAPGQTRSVRVAFSPSTLGGKSASLDIATNDTDHTTATISLAGNATPATLAGNTSTLDFSTVDTGQSGAATVELFNPGGSTIDVTDIAISGTDADQFAVIEDADLPDGMPAGDTRNVTVTYTPTITGDHTAALIVTTTSSDTHTTSLVGTGAGPDISLPVGPLTFGDVGVDNTSQELLNVTNIGDRDLSISGATITGPNANQFTIVDRPDLLLPGKTAGFLLEYGPSEAGSHDATLELTSDDPDEPTATHDLAGTGAAPRIGVDNRTLDFGNVSVNDTVTMNLTVRNLATSKGPLTVDNTVLTGRNPGDFGVVHGDAPFTLAPGESQRLEVGFTPIEEGQKDAQLQIISNAGNDPQIDVWLSNSRTYLVVQSIDTDDSNSTQRMVNIDANRVLPNGDLSVNVSRPDTRLENVSFDRLNMSVTPGGDFTMNLTHGDAPSNNSVADFSDSGASPIKYVTLDHSLPNAAYANTSIVFRVRTGALRSGVHPDDVVFHRYSNGNWNAIQTTNVQSDSSTHFFSVDTPGFSEFVITQPTNPDDSSGSPSGSTQTRPPNLAFTGASTVSFSSLYPGTTATRTIEVSNTGGSPGTIDTISLLGDDAGAFTVVDAQVTLGPGEIGEVTVEFAPFRTGGHDAILSLDDTETSVALTGTAMATVSTDESSLTFEDVPVGETETRWITVNVPDGAPSSVTITDLHFVGGDIRDFDAIDNRTPFTVAPGESETVAVQHTPSGPGQKTATLRIHTDAPANDQIDISISNRRSAIIVRPLTDDAPNVNVEGIRIDADSMHDLNTTTAGTARTDVFVEGLEFTVLRSGNFSKNLTHSDTPIGTTWPAFTESETEILKHVKLTHTLSNDDLDDTAVRFRVARSRVIPFGASPEDVAFYRYDGTRWVAMPITLVEESARSYHYRSETPGFSEFVVTAPQSNVTVVDSALSTDNVSVGESITLTASVWNNRSTETATTVRLIRNGTTIDTTSLTLTANETRTISFTPSFDDAGAFTLQVNDYHVGTITVYVKDQTDTNDIATSTSDHSDNNKGPLILGDDGPDSANFEVDDTDPKSTLWIILLLAGFLLFYLLWRRREKDDNRDLSKRKSS